MSACSFKSSADSSSSPLFLDKNRRIPIFFVPNAAPSSTEAFPGSNRMGVFVSLASKGIWDRMLGGYRSRPNIRSVGIVAVKVVSRARVHWLTPNTIRDRSNVIFGSWIFTNLACILIFLDSWHLPCCSFSPVLEKICCFLFLGIESTRPNRSTISLRRRSRTISFATIDASGVAIGPYGEATKDRDSLSVRVRGCSFRCRFVGLVDDFIVVSWELLL